MTPLPVRWPAPGRYILAISGGADSMVLLDLFAAAAVQHSYQLMVAHFDHGLRLDSAADAQFVAGAAKRYGLPFVSRKAALGQASEATARAARHSWLESIRDQHQAAAVVTAHHQDDLIETSLLNLARGSGRRGLAPMQDHRILRPLLAISRSQLRSHAAHHHLAWREDPTNADLSNPRNFLRRQLLPAATPAWQHQYLALINRLAGHNLHIDTHLQQLLDHHQSGSTYALPRHLIRDLTLAELAELILLAARRLQPAVELDQRLLAELTLFAKTGRPHRRRPIRQDLALRHTPQSLVIGQTDPVPAHSAAI